MSTRVEILLPFEFFKSGYKGESNARKQELSLHHHIESNDVTMSVDLPIGIALPQTPTPADKCKRRSGVIFTTNPAPEYLYLLGTKYEFILLCSKSRISGKSLNPAYDFKKLQIASLLTPAEITILSRLSHGLSIKSIANQFSIADGSLRNYLTIIYEKLSVSTRSEAQLYFWGIWRPLLSLGWTPPVDLIQQYAGVSCLPITGFSENESVYTSN